MDKIGNKWIGTSKFGLLKFYGNTFNPINKTNSLIGGTYTSPIYKDKNGNMWISYNDKTPTLAKFDGEKWEIFDKKDHAALNEGIICISEDKTGKIYFGTSKGLLTYYDNKWEKIILPRDSIYLYAIRAIDIDAKGNIALGHNSGLLLFNGKDWNSFNDNNSELQLSVVTAVKYSPSGELYIGYGGGLGQGGFSILKDGKWQHYNKYNSKLPDQTVSKIKFTTNGNIWMATNNGMLKIAGKKWKVLHFGNEHAYGDTMMDVDIENDKSIWIANSYDIVHYTEK